MHAGWLTQRKEKNFLPVFVYLYKVIGLRKTQPPPQCLIHSAVIFAFYNDIYNISHFFYLFQNSTLVINTISAHLFGKRKFPQELTMLNCCLVHSVLLWSPLWFQNKSEEKVTIYIESQDYIKQIVSAEDIMCKRIISFFSLLSM